MLKDALDLIIVEGSFTFVGSLARNGVLMGLEMFAYLGSNGLFIEVSFTLSLI